MGNPIAVGVFPGWPELETRIARRAERMFASGLIEEAQRLRTAYPNLSATAAQAIGLPP